ncbi:NlpC/P60 family protein [Alkalicoccobacillus gibsonii]|uniref:NlpC/P60 family protein n=1 Tax=Alkalicoccobacillus gibsonii TaxID=79881 RepID=UPI0019324F44|nr:NlpC/P60 family protein [Alkalicoccobacillus gibsonii]MBM0067508.1 C40 family peptidase [Alkalicoccobacillus gibsonii]
MGKYCVYIDNAISWAEDRLGSIDYAYICLAFVEDALERSNHIEIFGGDSAKESANLYAESISEGIPQKGSFVFYDCSGPINGDYKNWGHVGLSIGHGKVIHAWDKVRINGYLDIENLSGAPGWNSPKIIGWVPLERIMQGYQKKVYE